MLLAAPSSPLHSEAKRLGAPGPCFMQALREWVLAKGQAFPIAANDFHSTAATFLADAPQYRDKVGLWDGGAKGRPLEGAGDEHGAHLTWMRYDNLPAQFATRGEAAIALASDPVKLLNYHSQWDQWFFSELPALLRPPYGVNSSVPQWVQDASSQLPPASSSVLLQTTHSCAKWNVLATLMAFFGSVTTALIATPFFTMGAIAIFSRSLIISYAAFYCLVAMILTLLGMMHLLGIPLGPVPALALALVVGMSVDYIIHLAHAFKNSLFDDRFYKSRAAVFARAVSVVSAAITTLGAVTPLLGAQLLILREFGQIFVMVTLIAISFSVAFLVVLMLIGPRRTRGMRKLEAREEAEETRLNAEQRITDAHSEGDNWALQVNVADPAGAPRQYTASRQHAPHEAGALAHDSAYGGMAPLQQDGVVGATRPAEADSEEML